MAVVRTREQLQRTKNVEFGGITFTVKLADNRAVLARQNLFDTVRYITEDATGRQITERKFPMGDLRLETVMLVLTAWDLTPAEDAISYPITHKNVVELLEPSELQDLYDAILEMNTVWGGDAGEG